METVEQKLSSKEWDEIQFEFYFISCHVAFFKRSVTLQIDIPNPLLSVDRNIITATLKMFQHLCCVCCYGNQDQPSEQTLKDRHTQNK